jgi:hypothetical protein
MVLGQKCRDRARKEMAQIVYTQTLLNDFARSNPGSVSATPRARSSRSARMQRFAQSQVSDHENLGDAMIRLFSP